jgi:3-hydroxyisobutyrate dehydrogenase-like beta-hydroxyacid dehydrogenase
MKAAFLGLGIMGSAIAANLLKGGVELTLWNRSPKGHRKDPRFAGARFADTPAAAVADAEIVLYCLGNDAAIEAVVFGQDGVLSGLRPGQLVIDMATVHPDTSRREGAGCAARGAGFLDAAPFGSRPEAEAAELHFVIGGSAADFARAQGILKLVSAATYHMGPVGSGAAMGLVGSLVVCLQIQALGEALVLAKKAGLDLTTVVKLLGVTDFRSPLFTAMGPEILERRFDPVFSLDHMFKDARQIMSFATQLNVPVPGCALVHEMIKSGIAHGWGHENCSALVKTLEIQANVIADAPR